MNTPELESLHTLEDWMSTDTLDVLGISHVQGTRRNGVWYAIVHAYGNAGHGKGDSCQEAMTEAYMSALRLHPAN